MQILGEQFGIEIIGSNESGIILQLMTEDDGHWGDVTVFSAFWLDDFIGVLQAVQKQLGTVED